MSVMEPAAVPLSSMKGRRGTCSAQSSRDLSVLGAGFGLGYLAARALGSSTGDTSDTGGTGASGAGDPYVIVYHAKLGFRAAPIQMLLIDAGRAFEMAEPHWGTDRVIENNPGLPSFAPPALRKGDVTIAQTPAILAFLDATVLGRSSGGRVEDATRLQLLLDIGDVTSELFTEVRKGAEAKAKFGRLEDGGRLRNWLAHICKFFLRAGGGTNQTVTHGGRSVVGGGSGWGRRF